MMGRASMSEQTFAELKQLNETQGPAATIDRLIATLRSDKQYHQLFDALLLKKKHELGLSLAKPTSLDDVPEEKRDEVEAAYVEAAREVGELLLADNQIAHAWMYLRTIREPKKIVEALDALATDGPAPEELIDIAFFQGISPITGLKMLLKSHGTCSTITSLDQQFGQMSPEIRMNCARVMVQEMYDNLRETIQLEVQRKQAMTPPGQSLRELIAGREWLFADENYHVDVSHLSSVVRFARALDTTCKELDLALQLSQYGTHLSPRYQYAGNAPFEDFYPAHIQYFKALLGDGREAAIAYFREKMGDDAADPESQLSAFALFDLLTRLGKNDEALDLACTRLKDSAEEFGISLPELCVKAGRYDQLLKLADEKQDLVTYAAALVGSKG